MTDAKRPGPIEVWLTKHANGMSCACRVVHEDESATVLDVESASMRGAQREVTAWFIDQGYKPNGRWDVQAQAGDDVIEAVRQFRPT